VRAAATARAAAIFNFNLKHTISQASCVGNARAGRLSVHTQHIFRKMTFPIRISISEQIKGFTEALHNGNIDGAFAQLEEPIGIGTAGRALCLNRQLIMNTYPKQKLSRYMVRDIFDNGPTRHLGVGGLEGWLKRSGRRTKRSLSMNHDVRVAKFEAREAIQNDDDLHDDTCVICLTQLRTHAFIPCGHKCVCKDCSDKLKDKKCPICRVKSSSVIKVFG